MCKTMAIAMNGALPKIAGVYMNTNMILEHVSRNPAHRIFPELFGAPNVVFLALEPKERADIARMLYMESSWAHQDMAFSLQELADDSLIEDAEKFTSRLAEICDKVAKHWDRMHGFHERELERWREYKESQRQDENDDDA